MLMLDTIGTRYRCLPSEALTRATTVDLHILSEVLGYYRRRDNPDSTISTSREYTTEELTEILNRNKNK